MADIYEQLGSEIDQAPGLAQLPGAPLTPSRGEVDILRMLFTKEEAEVAIQLTAELETVDQLSAKTGLPREELAKTLARMAEKGGIWQEKREGEPCYRLMAFVPGIYEAQAMNIDKQVAHAFEKIFPEFGMAAVARGHSGLRVLPAEQSISGMEVRPDQKASWWVSQAQAVAITDCVCKKQQKLVGRGCSRPMDSICVYLDSTAEFCIDAGIARKATVAEALRALQRAENGGSIHMITPVVPPVAICNCCPECCLGLRPITEFNGVPSQMVICEFLSTVKADLCNGCEACVAVCPFTAISMEQEKAVVNAVRCIGCGLCVLACLEGAASLAARKQEG